jgi:hypothetical protein
MNRIAAELIAEYPGLRLDREFAPLSLQPVPRFSLHDGRVSAVDGALNAGAGRPVGLPSTAQLLAASPDLSIVVATVGDQVIVAGDSEF